MFKKRLKELREEKNISQMELAKQTNISQSSIAKWELGKREPTAYNIVTLCKFFHVSADYLLGLEDETGRKTEENA